MSSPIEQVHEARERHESGHGPRWIPIAAAALAVLAALTGFLGNLRATASLTSKNDAVIATTRASDAWNEYQAASIKQHIYEAQRDAGAARANTRIDGVIASEKQKKAPLAKKAHGFEHDAETANEHSERLLAQHEYFEVGAALFEVAIVLVSIVALAGGRVLPFAAAVAAGVGLLASVYALIV